MRPLLKSLLLTLPMMLLTLLTITRGQAPSGPIEAAAIIATFLFFNSFFFLMVHTGKTDRFRATIFIVYGVAFVIAFISHLIEARGSMALTEAAMMKGETPFCHIVIPMTLIPAALTKTIIFPGSIIGGFASISSMFILWIGASLSLGRGFCGWACFFGGLDEGFSRIFRRPLIRRIDPLWSYLPYAVLLAIVLTAAISLSPTYCQWLCPFKTVTEYVQVTSLKIAIQTGIFLTLFAGLVVVLPALTKRRTQCGLFCPFGAFQSFTNKVNAFDIRIDKEKCVNCGQCARFCPTFSMDKASIDAGRSRLTCTKCGKCVDICPKGAISYHVKGAPISGKRESHRLLFLYPAFLFLATMAGANVKEAIVRLVKLVATGSMI
jgi:polyferredoxin